MAAFGCSLFCGGCAVAGPAVSVQGTCIALIPRRCGGGGGGRNVLCFRSVECLGGGGMACPPTADGVTCMPPGLSWLR